MRCELVHTNTLTIDLPVNSLSWAGTFSRQLGTAELFVPRDSPAYSERYIRLDGGSRVTISDQRLGIWRGIVTEQRWESRGLTLYCQEIGLLAGSRVVGRRVFEATTPGVIAAAAFRDAFGGGLVGIRPGTFTSAPPLLYGYQFSAQSFSQVLSDLMAQSGQEWEIDDAGAFNWQPRVGTSHPTLLVEGQDLRNVQFQTSISETATEVLAYLPATSSAQGGERVAAQASDVAASAAWPAQRVVSLTTGAATEARGQLLRALERARYPVLTVTLVLDKRHWTSVRQGDTLRCLLTHAGFDSRILSGRVASRAYREAADELTLSLSVVPAITAETVAGQIYQTGGGGGGGTSRGTDSPIRDAVAPSAPQGVTGQAVAQGGGSGSSGSYSDITLNGLTTIAGPVVIPTPVKLTGRFDWVGAINLAGLFSLNGEPKTARLPEADGSTTLFTCFEMERTRFGQLIDWRWWESWLPRRWRERRIEARLDGRFKRWTQEPRYRIGLSGGEGKALVLADVRDDSPYQIQRFGGDGGHERGS